MLDQWYYGYAGARHGPFSAQQLRELAESGRLQPSDTVWKEGVEQGMAAHQVKNLFPPEPPNLPEPLASGLEPAVPPEGPTAADRVEPAQEAAVPDTQSPSPVPEAAAPAPEPAAPQAEAASKSKPAASSPKPHKARALAIKGAIITGQDGVMVQFRKKCIKCGHEDAAKSRLPIKPGQMRITFFCPKCRRLQPVEIQGMA